MAPSLLLAEAASLVDMATLSLTRPSPETLESSIASMGQAVGRLRMLREELKVAAPSLNPSLSGEIQGLKDRIEQLNKLLKQIGTFCQGAGERPGRGQIRYQPEGSLAHHLNGPGRFLGNA